MQALIKREYRPYTSQGENMNAFKRALIVAETKKEIEFLKSKGEHFYNKTGKVEVAEQYNTKLERLHEKLERLNR